MLMIFVGIFKDMILIFKFFHRSEIEAMKKTMEADIRAQLEANMAMMNNNAESWEQRVCSFVQ